MIYFLVCIQKPTVSSTNSFIIVGYFSENPENKRKFLDNFAKQKGFDPLIAENWYTIQISDIKEEQVCLIFLSLLIIALREELPCCMGTNIL